MLKNDSTPPAASPEPPPTPNKKCAAALKTVLAKRQEKPPPSTKKQEEFDPHNAEIPINPIPQPPHWALKNPLPPLFSQLQSGKNENESNTNEIKSGIALKRVYNIEKAEVVNPNFKPKKGKVDKSKDLKSKELKSKELDKKQHVQVDKTEKIREQIKKIQKIKEEPITLPSNNNPKTQIKPPEKLTPQQKLEEKLRKRTTAEKALNDRRAASQPAFTKLQPEPEPTPTLPAEPSPSDQKRSLENRLTTKIWQILSRDIFLLDHDKFNSQIQATNSETKQYIINVIKRCNNKEIKRLNRPKVTQTVKENSFANSVRNKKRAMKIAVRRRVWQLAKASIKRSKHWSQFLAENHIIVENINIDKFDLSLIDLEALGIENKLLKRTVTWLFN